MARVSPAQLGMSQDARVCWQISPEGKILMVATGCVIFKIHDRHKTAAMLELLALMFCLIQMESEIRAHVGPVIIMTDCVSLGMVHRMKHTSSKMIEISLFISSFRNLHVRYSIGASLFLADLITRQYNKIDIEGDKEKLSESWAELQPVMDKKLMGTTIKPEALTDLLLSSPASEYIDVFAKRQYYDQSLSRYHNSKLEDFTNAQPRELVFLASVYSGFNGDTMTATQYHELENLLRNFPAQAQARRLKNSNLGELRKNVGTNGCPQKKLWQFSETSIFRQVKQMKRLLSSKRWRDLIYQLLCGRKYQNV